MLPSIYKAPNQFSWPNDAGSQDRRASMPKVDPDLRVFPDLATPAAFGLPIAELTDRARLYPYYQPPFSNHDNGCGQAAMASMLVHWGVLGADPGLAEALYQHELTKPDILWGIFGTSWERVRDTFLRYGLRAATCNVARLTVWSSKGKYEWLESWVRAGYPACVIVGNGEMGAGAGAHWAIVTEINPNQVVMANFATPNGYDTIDTSTFMKAWEAYGLPGVHYATVIPSRG